MFNEKSEREALRENSKSFVNEAEKVKGETPSLVQDDFMVQFQKFVIKFSTKKVLNKSLLISFIQFISDSLRLRALDVYHDYGDATNKSEAKKDMFFRKQKALFKSPEITAVFFRTSSVKKLKSALKECKSPSECFAMFNILLFMGLLYHIVTQEILKDIANSRTEKGDAYYKKSSIKAFANSLNATDKSSIDLDAELPSKDKGVKVADNIKMGSIKVFLLQMATFCETILENGFTLLPYTDKDILSSRNKNVINNTFKKILNRLGIKELDLNLETASENAQNIVSDAE